MRIFTQTFNTTMDLYNLAHLVRIEVLDISPSIWFKWKPEKVRFGRIIQKEGVYYRLTNELEYTTVPDYFILKDGFLYDKPRVILHFESGEKTYYFDSLDKANVFRDKIIKQSNSIFI